jgi:hypothetical protein
MNALEAALVVAVVSLIIHFLLQLELGRLCDPRYIRRRGVAIQREEVLEDRSEVIGRYHGRDIYASVVFMGMRYRFDRVAPRVYRYRVAERELFLEPGLIYVTD